MTAQHPASAPKVKPDCLRVYMLDLLPTVPYYTGYLCAALKSADSLSVDMGAATYYLDRDFYDRRHLRADSKLVDLVSGLNKVPAAARRVAKMGEYFSNLASLLVRFGANKPDVLHVQFLPLVRSGIPGEIAFLKQVRRMGIAIVYTVHNVLPQDGGEDRRAAYQQVYDLAGRLICHDQEAATRLINEFAIPADRITIIPHGPLLEPPPTTDPVQTRAKLGVQSDEAMVLWQGIVKPYKGVAFLLNAWKEVQAAGVRAKLVIAGTGDANIVAELRQQAKDLGVESSVVMDFRFLSVKEVAEYYAAADIITYPYREITTSGALMTGICYGKAVVASRQPAFSTILQHGENSLISDYGDVPALASGLQLLIEQPALRKRLGEAARKTFLRGPRWEDIASATENCYRSTVTANRQERA